MKKILIVFTVSLLSKASFGQCEEFSKQILDIIKFETYPKLGNFILPIEQQRKVLHFTDTDSINNILLSIRKSLEDSVIKSAVDYRKLHFKKHPNSNKIDSIACSRKKKRIARVSIRFKLNGEAKQFHIDTYQTDKLYFTLPINYNSDLLDSFDDIQEKMKNIQSDPNAEIFTIISGIRFKNFNPNEKELNKGTQLLQKELESTPAKDYYILPSDGLIDSIGVKYLHTKVLYPKEDKLIFYWINLSKETCTIDTNMSN